MRWFLSVGLGFSIAVNGVGAEPLFRVSTNLLVAASHEASNVVPRHVTWELLQPGARAGMGLLGGVDVNGDGFSDVLFSASRQNAPLSGSGCVYVFTRLGKGEFGTPEFVLEGAPRGAGFGSSLSAMPDLDGDGQAELFVGAPGVPFAKSAQGTVFCFPIRPNTTALADWTAKTNARFVFPGRAAMPAGDVNADGRPDLLVTLPLYEGRYPREGAVWLFLGRTNGLKPTPDWVATGGRSNAVFGFSAAAAGDVNGDGFDDIIVGAARLSGNDHNAGSFSVFFGSSTGLQARAGFAAEGETRAAHLGEAVSGRGDLNGDGLADVAIGEPGEAHKSGGRVWIYYGSRSGLSHERSETLVGTPGAAFGGAVAIVGDVNGDGCADLVVGEPEQAGRQWRDGRAYLFLGSPRGVNPAPACVIDAGRRGGRYALRVAAAGDVDGDGLSDFLIGSPYWNTGKQGAGRVDLIFGSRTGFAKQTQFFACKTTNAPTPVMVRVTHPVSPGPRSFPRRDWPLWLAVIVVPVIGASAAVWAVLKARRTADAKLDHERARIARDLHDDLGAQISLAKTRGDAAGEAATQEMLLALDRAIWSVDPARDTLENLVTFLGDFTEQALAGTNIRSFHDLPTALPHQPLTPAFRKNVFLTVKEALNNAVKHSGASEVWLRARLENTQLIVEVEDNGRGMPAGKGPNSGERSSSDTHRSEPGRLCGGNGLRNMRQRIEEIGGELAIASPPGRGTRVTIRVKV